MLRRIMIFAFCFYSSTLFAKTEMSCPEAYGPKEIAREILQTELSGIRFKGKIKQNCLAQKNHPHVLIVKESNQEEDQKIFGSINNIEDIDIYKVELINPRTYAYKAYFRLKIGGKRVQDSVTFFRYKTKKQHQIYGCGAIVDFPKKLFLFKRCH